MPDTPTPVTPDYTTQPLTPPVTPTPGQSLSGVKPQPQSFKTGFVQGLRPQYTTDDQGNIIPKTTGAPSGRGLLGSVLAGAVMGALHGAAATKKGERGGVAFGSGVRMDQEMREEQAQESKKQAQQSFQNRQSTQKLNMEQQEAQDKHNQAILMAHNISATTAKTLQDTAFEADTHPYEIKLKQLGLDKDAATLAVTRQTLQTNDLDIAKNIESMGMDPTIFLNSYEDAQANIGRLHGENPQFALANGLPAGQEGRGASMYNVSDLNRPLPRDVTYYSYPTVDKQGNPVPTKHTLVADGNNTIATYMQGAMQGQRQLQQTNDALKTKADIAAKQSEVVKNKAEANKANADAELSHANAVQLGKFGVNIPPAFKYPDGGFTMSPAALQANLVAQGVPVPPNFQSLWAIAHYDADLKTEAQRLYKGGAGMTADQALNWIRATINPNYDETVYGAAQKVENEFADSKTNSAGGNLNAFNAATLHLGQLWDAADALQNNNIAKLNTLVNTIKTETGSPVKPSFDSIKAVLAGEIGKTIKGGAATDQEIAEMEKTINSSQSPAALQGVAQTYAHAMLAKAGVLARQYSSIKGHLPPRVLDPEAMAAYQKMGIDPNTTLSQISGSPVGASANTASVPEAVVVDGKVIGISTDGRKTYTPIQGNPDFKNQTIPIQ